MWATHDTSAAHDTSRQAPTGAGVPYDSQMGLHLLLLAACARPPADTGVPVVSDSSADSAGDSAADTSADTAADTSVDTDDPCAGVPTLAWSNFGEGFMVENCQGCHASTATERYGAPTWATFDTVDQCWDLANSILGAATGDSPSMPPRGGVSDDDRTRLQWWLQCGTPGT